MKVMFVFLYHLIAGIGLIYLGYYLWQFPVQLTASLLQSHFFWAAGVIHIYYAVKYLIKSILRNRRKKEFLKRISNTRAKL